MAENHPVGFQWVMEARERGAKVIHVDPRFTRTSAMCSKYVADPCRQRHRVPRRDHQLHPRARAADFREYVVNYTNAPVIVARGVPGHGGPRRPLLGLGCRDGSSTTTTTWQYAGMELHGAAGQREEGASAEGARVGPRRRRRDAPARRAARGGLDARAPALRLPAPEAALSRATRRNSSREICGCRAEEFLEVAEALCENSGRERTSAFVYAVGWTQHTVGVQIHPRRGDHPAPARQHRPARRRDHGAARARVDPGLDRHPDALRHPPGLPADAARRTRTRDCRGSSRSTSAATAGGATSGTTWSAC